MWLTSRDLDANQRCSTTQSWSSCSGSQERSWRSGIAAALLDELEPVEAARRHRQQIRQLADLREARAAEDLDGVAALVLAEVELDRLRAAREVVHAQHHVVLVAAHVREDPRVRRLQRLVGAEAEHGVL